jgi:hypothetical protein
LYDDDFVKCVFIALLNSSSKRMGMGDGEWDEDGGHRRRTERREIFYF